MDTDKLIELISDQSPLWDKGLKEYCDKNIREKCWLVVAEGLCDNFKRFSTEEKQKKISEMKNKWRNIRDNYVRFLNKEKSGETAKKKYVYANALEFLRNSIEKRSTSGIFDDLIEMEKTLEEGDADFLQEPTPPDNTPTLQPPIKRKKRKSSSSRSKFQTKNLKQMNPPPIPFSSILENDPDRAYLTSILPNYRRLYEDDKLEFQQMVLNFFMNKKKMPTTETQPNPSNNIPNYNYRFPSQNHPQLFALYQPSDYSHQYPQMKSSPISSSSSPSPPFPLSSDGPDIIEQSQ